MSTSRHRRLPLGALAAIAAAVALAAALLACQGGQSITEAPSRSARAEERRTSVEPSTGDAPATDPGPAATTPAAPADEATDEAADGVDRAAQAARPPAAPPVIDDLWPNKGPASGGDRVEIRGRNLRPSLVLFGSVPATVLGVREEGGTVTLTLEAPPARAGAARVYVVVTNSDGQYAVAGEKFEYYN